MQVVETKGKASMQFNNVVRMQGFSQDQVSEQKGCGEVLYMPLESFVFNCEPDMWIWTHLSIRYQVTNAKYETSTGRSEHIQKNATVQLRLYSISQNNLIKNNIRWQNKHKKAVQIA